MTITPDQAQEWIDGATDGPWGRTGMGALIDADGNALVTDPDGNMSSADADLAAAAPDLAQTVIDQAKRIEELEAQLAGVQWEYGVEQATGTTQWFRSRPMAEAHAEARGAFRLVRKPVGSVEVIDGE